MSKKKSVMSSPDEGSTLPVKDAPANPPDDVAKRRNELRTAIKNLVEGALFYRQRMDDEVIERLAADFDRQIETRISSLESVEKKDLEKEQGHIAGLRQARRIMLGADNVQDLERLRNELEKLEEANALFLKDDAHA